MGEQAAADPARVDQLSRLCVRDTVQMEAGDALFFDCNLLHCSANNDSDRRRYAVIAAFNKRSNSPLWEHHHPQYTPLEMVSTSGEGQALQQPALGAPSPAVHAAGDGEHIRGGADVR